jgi:hypothetical protein
LVPAPAGDNKAKASGRETITARADANESLLQNFFTEQAWVEVDFPFIFTIGSAVFVTPLYTYLYEIPTCTPPA